MLIDRIKRKYYKTNIEDNIREIIWNEYKKVFKAQKDKADEFECLLRPPLFDPNIQEKMHYKQVEKEFTLLSGQLMALSRLVNKL